MPTGRSPRITATPNRVLLNNGTIAATANDFTARHFALVMPRMTIELSDHETGAEYDGDYHDDLKELQDRMARLQARMIVHRKRAILLLEGWDAAGKGGIVKRLTAGLDPRYFEVFSDRRADPAREGAPFSLALLARSASRAQSLDLRPQLVRPRAGRAGRGLRKRGRMDPRL